MGKTIPHNLLHLLFGMGAYLIFISTTQNITGCFWTSNKRGDPYEKYFVWGKYFYPYQNAVKLCGILFPFITHVK